MAPPPQVGYLERFVCPTVDSRDFDHPKPPPADLTAKLYPPKTDDVGRNVPRGAAGEALGSRASAREMELGSRENISAPGSRSAAAAVSNYKQCDPAWACYPYVGPSGDCTTTHCKQTQGGSRRGP